VAGRPIGGMANMSKLLAFATSPHARKLQCRAVARARCALSGKAGKAEQSMRSIGAFTDI
jgi:hypothetical protein